ncbi:hypothetical protein MNV49_007501 [Pseudohyphozyma bogoriensis]|nr:hypothetical protein MNV49_007501 [Pseudohyphozyma bogoriensis]
MSLLLHERSESPSTPVSAHVFFVFSSVVYHPLSRRSVTLLAPGKKPKHASASSSKSTPAPSTSGPSRSLKSYPVELQYGIVYNSDLESLRQNAMAERNGPHYFVAFMEEFLKSGVNGWQWVDDRDPAHYTGVFGHVAAPSTHPQYSLPALPALPGPSPREPSRRWLPALRYYTLVTSPEKDRKKLDNIRGRKSVIHYLYLCTDEGNKIDQMVLDTLDLNQLTHLCIQRTPGNRCDARSFLKSCHALRSYEVHVTRGFSELGASATPGLALQLSHITITGEKYTNILNLGYTFAAAPNLRTLQVLRPTTWQESHSWSWNKISGYAAEVARTETYLIGCAHLQYVEWGAWQSYAVTQYPAIMAAARGAVPGPGMFLDHIGAFNALTDLKIIMEPSWFSFSIPTLQRLQIGTGRPPYRTLGADQRHAPRQATPDYAPSNSLGDRVLLPGVFDHDDDDGFASWGEPDPNRSNAPWDAPPTPPDVRAAETTARQHHEVREQLIAALERIFLGCPHLQYLGIFLHRDALAIERDIETTTLLPLLHAHQAEHAGFHWDFIDFDEWVEGQTMFG